MTKHVSFAIAGIVIVLFVHLFRLGSYSINPDEAVTLMIAKGRINEPSTYLSAKPVPLNKNPFTQFDYLKQNTLSNTVDAALRDNGNGILYNLSLHTWLNFFPVTVFNARLLSVLCALLCICLTYQFVNRIYNHQLTAVLTALLLGLHPLFLSYSHQARSPMMCLLFFLLSLQFLLTAKQNESIIHWCLTGLFALCSFLCHYLIIYAYLFAAIWFLLYQQTDWWKSRSQIVGIFCGFVLFVAGVMLWFKYFGGDKGLEVIKNQNEVILTLPDSKLSIGNYLKGLLRQLSGIFGIHFQFLGFRIREYGIFI
ncbi:MAG TPA: glycosyltransferase family 39 protein, partial [Flavobacteriales bacterium]|nr:glycosyltransferase family 39 protein [Flavobacteriales bacterium]